MFVLGGLFFPRRSNAELDFQAPNNPIGKHSNKNIQAAAPCSIPAINASYPPSTAPPKILSTGISPNKIINTETTSTKPISRV